MSPQTARRAEPVPVGGHPVPERLRVSQDPGVRAWREHLPEIVEALREQWRLRLEAPFEPGGSSAWVAPVREASGAERVLKVAWAHEESRDEAAGLLAWQGRGAVRVHRSAQHGETSALLMDRVRPGTPLRELLTWPARDEVVAAVARRLWRPPQQLVDGEAATAFRPLAQMCAWWADKAQQRADAGLSPLPADLVAHGLQLFRELPARWDGEPVLLATDLHPENVLLIEGHGGASGGDDAGRPGRAPVPHPATVAAGRSWVLIDPKPYVGDPHYDVLQHMLNDPKRLRDHPGRFAERMADLAGLDPHRVRRWLLARCVQGARHPGPGGLEAAAPAALALAADGVE